MTFDPTITFGAAFNAFVLIVGFAVAFTKIGGRIDLLAQRVSAVEDILKSQIDVASRITAVETRQVTHGQMIVAIQQAIRDLQYGRGFVRNQGPGRDGINGEYT